MTLITYKNGILAADKNCFFEDKVLSKINKIEDIVDFVCAKAEENFAEGLMFAGKTSVEAIQEVHKINPQISKEVDFVDLNKN